MPEPRVVLVTGPFRSGTSLVAQIVHRLGWQVAALIPAPIPPAWRSDWEDIELTVRLMRRAALDRDEIATYIKWRVDTSMRTGFGHRIALKSPYLALVWKNLLAAIGEPAPVIVRTYRNEPERLRSLEAHPALSRKDDEAIRTALREIVPTIEIGYEFMVDHPQQAAAAVARAIGVQDDVAIAAAAALIGSPTRYEPCPHSPQQSQQGGGS